MKSNHVRVLLAAVAAAMALTACSPTEMGAAAVVGDQRITSGELSGNVEALQREARAAGIDPAQFQLPATLPQTVLNQLVTISQFNQIAARQGISVTEGEIEAEIRRIETSNNNTPFDKLVVSAAVPRARGRDVVRVQIIQTKLLAKLGITQQTTQQEATAKLDKERATVPISWNPRYGSPAAGGQGEFTIPDRFGAADAG